MMYVAENFLFVIMTAFLEPGAKRKQPENKEFRRYMASLKHRNQEWHSLCKMFAD